MLKLVRSLVDLVVVKSCFACGAASAGPLCSGCESKLNYISGPSCLKCGYPTVREVINCRQCRPSNFYFETAKSLFAYEGVGKDALVTLKKENGYSLVDFLVKTSISNCAQFFNVDAVCFIPTTIVKRIDRGHNVSEIIASCFSHHLGVPLVKALFVNKSVVDQVGLNKEQRKKNLSDIFMLNESAYFAGTRILVVDDIFTTGATINEASRVLAGSGLKVNAFTIARRLL